MSNKVVPEEVVVPSQSNVDGTKVKFFSRLTKNLKTLKRPWKWSCLVFVVSFITVISLNFIFILTFPPKLLPVSYEGVGMYRTINAAVLAILGASFLAAGFLYYEITQKYLTAFCLAYLIGCVSISFVGISGTLEWLTSSRETKLEHMISYARTEFQKTLRFPYTMRLFEKQFDCCGFENFTNYPLHIFETERIPDHCCLNYAEYGSKNCGYELCANTPLCFTQKRNPVGTSKTPCMVKTNLTFEAIRGLLNFARSDLSAHNLDTLINTFDTNEYNKYKKELCESMDTSNYLDLYCVHTNDPNKYIQTQRYRWCFVLYYNTTAPSEYMIYFNRKFGFFKEAGCFDKALKHTDKIITFMFITFLIMIICSTVMAFVYLYTHHDIRVRDMSVYPLPLWLEELPGDNEDTLPKDLASKSHVEHFLAKATKEEALAYMELHNDDE